MGTVAMEEYCRDSDFLISVLYRVCDALGLKAGDRCYDGVMSAIYLNKNALKLCKESIKKLSDTAHRLGWKDDDNFPDELLHEFFDRKIGELYMAVNEARSEPKTVEISGAKVKIEGMTMTITIKGDIHGR